MAYNEGLAQVLRDDLAGETEVGETAMFGGLTFSVGGHMVCGVRGARAGGGMMARVGPDRLDAALALPGTARVRMGTRQMAGFVGLAPAGAADDTTRRALIAMALGHARSLPPRERPMVIARKPR